MGKYNGFNTGGGNMQQLMRQAQKMQQEVARVQGRLAIPNSNPAWAAAWSRSSLTEPRNSRA